MNKPIPVPEARAALEKFKGVVGKMTPGPWERQGIETDGCDYIIGSDLGGLVGATMPWPTELDRGEFTRVRANASGIVALRALAGPLLHWLDSHLMDCEEAGDVGIPNVTGFYPLVAALVEWAKTGGE